MQERVLKILLISFFVGGGGWEGGDFSLKPDVVFDGWQRGFPEKWSLPITLGEIVCGICIWLYLTALYHLFIDIFSIHIVRENQWTGLDFCRMKLQTYKNLCEFSKFWIHSRHAFFMNVIKTELHLNGTTRFWDFHLERVCKPFHNFRAVTIYHSLFVFLWDFFSLCIRILKDWLLAALRFTTSWFLKESVSASVKNVLLYLKT